MTLTEAIRFSMTTPAEESILRLMRYKLSQFTPQPIEEVERMSWVALVGEERFKELVLMAKWDVQQEINELYEIKKEQDMTTITISGPQGAGKGVLGRRVYANLLKDAKVKLLKSQIELWEEDGPYRRKPYGKEPDILIKTSNR